MLRPEKLDEMDVNIEEAIRQNELSVVYKQAKRWMDVIVTIMILPVALPLLAVAYGVTYLRCIR
jgi:lipopolysaccharide/colanic/teichoic acid biosynthesis glycosyltransferase